MLDQYRFQLCQEHFKVYMGPSCQQLVHVAVMLVAAAG